MALNLEQKKQVVAELAEVAGTAHSLVAAEYAGLTVEQLTDLRRKARQGGVYLKVAKNTLVSRAVEDTDYAVIKDELTGPLLYAFSQEDPGGSAPGGQAQGAVAPAAPGGATANPDQGSASAQR